MIIRLDHSEESLAIVMDLIKSKKSFCPVAKSIGTAELAGVERALQYFDVNKNEPGTLVIFTSGTAGQSKGVVLSPSNLKAAAASFGEAHGIGASDRWILSLPLHHISGLSVLFRSAVLGCDVLLPERREVKAFAATVMRSKATGISLVPTQLKALLDSGDPAVAAFRGCRILIGGAPLSEDLLSRARAAGLSLFESYGATETAAQVVNNGVPHRNVDVRCSAAGEILIRGPMVAKELLMDGGVFPALDSEGYWHSGDLGSLSADGKLRVTGRISDIINSGGVKIAPLEVEREILAHSAIADVAVFGEDDDRWGQAVTAVLVLRYPISMDELSAWVRERLGPQKVPKKYLFVDRIPRGESGKICRRRLVEELKP